MHVEDLTPAPAAKLPSKPRILLVDDGSNGIADRSGGLYRGALPAFDILPLSSLTHLQRFQKLGTHPTWVDDGPFDPRIALVDLDFGRSSSRPGEAGAADYGVQVVYALATHPRTEEIIPVLFSHDLLSSSPIQDLHATFCAYAAGIKTGDSGIWSVPKSPDGVRAAQYGFEAFRSNPTFWKRYRPGDPPAPGMSWIPAVGYQGRRGKTWDLIDLLLGTPALREFWRLYNTGLRLDNAVEEALDYGQELERKTASEEGRRSRVLGQNLRFNNRTEPAGGDTVAGFTGNNNELVDMTLEWQKQISAGSFLDLTDGLLTVTPPREPGAGGPRQRLNDARRQALETFRGRYGRFLGLPVIAAFADGYMEDLDERRKQRRNV